MLGLDTENDSTEYLPLCSFQLLPCTSREIVVFTTNAYAMASAQFLLCTPGTPSISGRAPRISAREWDAHRQKIETLYIKEDETLDRVIAIMSTQYAFVAMYV